MKFQCKILSKSARETYEMMKVILLDFTTARRMLMVPQKKGHISENVRRMLEIVILKTCLRDSSRMAIVI